jgi:uncharacterized protein (TIGR03085 family)
VLERLVWVDTNVLPRGTGNPTINPMTSLSKTERSALCDLALSLGPDAPTVPEGWTVRDLVVHLLVREGSPAAAGIAVPQLGRLTTLASDRLGRRDFSDLVERLRSGPPLYSPLRWSRLETLTNTVELFVHHEDVRRAQPSWQPRELPYAAESRIWGMLATAGKGPVRRAPVGVIVEAAGSGSRRTLKAAPSSVVVRGLPSEVTLFVFGRQEQARVELDGTPQDVAALTGTRLGL